MFSSWKLVDRRLELTLLEAPSRKSLNGSCDLSNLALFSGGLDSSVCGTFAVTSAIFCNAHLSTLEKQCFLERNFIPSNDWQKLEPFEMRVQERGQPVMSF